MNDGGGGGDGGGKTLGPLLLFPLLLSLFREICREDGDGS